jgi:cytochrome c553
VDPGHPADAIVSADGLRLLQAYAPQELNVPGVSEAVRVAAIIQSPDSPFAENRGTNADGELVGTLYRLSTGHGGVKCQGCHNSTHAVWPVKNARANDNIAARQLQGHTGTITECTTCHGRNSFNIEDDFRNNLDADGRMKGPHGMHPVNDPEWTEKHKEVDKNGRNSCRGCHGVDGEGTVLSRVADDRVFECEDEDLPGCRERSASGKTIRLERGTQVSCTQCHDNYINGDEEAED